MSKRDPAIDSSQDLIATSSASQSLILSTSLLSRSTSITDGLQDSIGSANSLPLVPPSSKQDTTPPSEVAPNTEVLYSASSETNLVQEMNRSLGGPAMPELVGDLKHINRCFIFLIFRLLPPQYQKTILEKISAQRNGTKGAIIMLETIYAFLAHELQLENNIALGTTVLSTGFIALFITIFVEVKQAEFRNRTKINQILKELIPLGGKIPDKKMSTKELLVWLENPKHFSESIQKPNITVSKVESKPTVEEATNVVTQNDKKQERAMGDVSENNIKQAEETYILREITEQDILTFAAWEKWSWILLLALRDMIASGNYLGSVTLNDYSITHLPDLISNPKTFVIFSIIGLAFAGLAVYEVEGQILKLTKSELDCKLALINRDIEQSTSNSEKTPSQTPLQNTQPSATSESSLKKSIDTNTKLSSSSKNSVSKSYGSTSRSHSDPRIINNPKKTIQALEAEKSQLIKDIETCQNKISKRQSLTLRQSMEYLRIALRGFQSGAMAAIEVTGIPTSIILTLKFFGITALCGATGPMGWAAFGLVLSYGLMYAIDCVFEYRKKTAKKANPLDPFKNCCSTTYDTFVSQFNLFGKPQNHHNSSMLNILGRSKEPLASSPECQQEIKTASNSR